MRLFLFTFFFSMTSLLFSQKSFSSEFFSFNCPSDFTFKRDVFIDGFVDVLTVNDEADSLSHLIYLHNTNIGSKIDSKYLVDNPNQYISDLNCEVLSSTSITYANYDGLELKVSFDGYEDIVGYIFMTAHNSTLRRIIFMMPSEEFLGENFSDVQATLNTLKLK